MPTVTIPTGYGFAQGLLITNGAAAVTGSTSAVTTSGTDYVVQVHLIGTAAATVYGALTTPPGAALDSTATADIAVYWWNGSAWTQIDCDLDQQTNGLWSTSNVTLWFKLQASIAGSGTDGNYLLAWGKRGTITAKNNWANLYPFQDDFLSWNSTAWGAQPAWATIAASVGTFSNMATNTGDYIQSYPYGGGYAFAARAIMPSTGPSGSDQNDADLGFLGHFLASPGIYYNGDTFFSATSVAVVSDNGSLTGHTGPAIDTTNYHAYAVARDPNQTTGYWWRDNGTVTTLTGALTGSGSTVYPSIVLYSGSPNAGYAIVVDWLKVRPFVAAEPTLAVAGSIISLATSRLSLLGVG